VTPPTRKSLMRSLGEFVGHLWFAARTDPSRYPDRRKHELRREVQEEQGETPAGKVTLRRTTVEEVEVER
jgi:hypothetical protein